MATTQSYLDGYLPEADARDLLNNGAVYICVQIKIETDENTGIATYEITGTGVNKNGDFMPQNFMMCPTPCPTTPAKPTKPRPTS
ncbi:MAG: hypothetical protein ABIN97_10795 [Ginsengibacter sp.]